jgi:hypothetical protein
MISLRPRPELRLFDSDYRGLAIRAMAMRPPQAYVPASKE